MVSQNILKTMKTIKPMKDDKGEKIYHEWLDAHENAHVFLPLFMNDPGYRFKKSFPEKNEHNMLSESEDLWDLTPVYDKFRNGKDGFLKDKDGKVRKDVPVIRRYIIGTGENRNKLIDKLVETFQVYPDGFPNKERIIKNLKAQKISRGSANVREIITPEDGSQTGNISGKSKCATIPMIHLYKQLFGPDFEFEAGLKYTFTWELISPPGEEAFIVVKHEGLSERDD